MDQAAAKPGPAYEIAFYEPGPAGDDPDGKAYYLLDIPGRSAGGAYWAYPEDVEPFSTGVPSRTKIAGLIAANCVVSEEGMDISETDLADDGTLELVGRTDDGLPFVATVNVVSVVRADF